MNDFVKAMKEEIDNTVTLTENGMVARETTADYVVDLFYIIGTPTPKDQLLRVFTKALHQDADLTLRVILWGRDCRGGAGRRDNFQTILNHMEETYPSVTRALISLIPEIGRYDELLCVKSGPVREFALSLFAHALRNKEPLALKWAPREKSARKNDALDLMKIMGMTPRQYRKYLATYTKVVENQMCAKEWEAIEFEKVPSLASTRYQTAFKRHQEGRYSAYLDKVNAGEAKMNASVVYPHNILESLEQGNIKAADTQWKQLPDYFDNDTQVMPVIDVSGSMFNGVGSVEPIKVSIALGLYCAEKNKSAFKDHFITFSGKPKLQKVSGTLNERVTQIRWADWGMSTNIELVFKTILSMALEYNVPQTDMPNMVLIFSDMQFDRCIDGESAMEMVERLYENAGYKIPKLVFWNLNSKDNVPVEYNKSGAALVSGFSPAIMKSILSDKLEDFSPRNVMLDAIMKDRYKVI